MRAFVKACKKLASWMNVIAGALIFLMMLLTVTDITLRYFGIPVLGTYELMAVAGAIVICYAIPKTSWDRGHIHVDLLIENRSEKVKKVIFVLTRIPGIALFIALTIFLFLKGYSSYSAAEVSLILRMPQYFISYVLAFACLVEALVLVADIFKVFSEGEAT
jgi:TRAP-type C4-dicarboxylate transport system permease small subunit